ncbi:tRNA lysidine(34) synthetase TilS [Ascidiimonas aurantiaca]|uniref:tRNA lysidine(34) synthetase TilS n=1 Tax=Ascidiimonas aurantiaca TaxID=1685432 RepID=UPI0030EC2AE1
MQQHFIDHIEQHFPEIITSKLLLAVSGGLDSVVLAHLCKQADLSFSIAHCNFRLRGSESNDDEAFVRRLGEILQVPLHVKRFDTKAAVHASMSVQMAARELRYHWFQELLTEQGYDLLLTAHHLDDNLETFLINLSRGTGLEGLAGIPARNESIRRPLLPFSKKEIEAYAQKHKLAWREDGSNKETKYLRNQIRHEVVPRLKELAPSFLENFKTTQSYLRGSADILKLYISEFRSVLFHKEEGMIKVPVASLRKLKPREAFLYELFKDFGFTQWKDVFHLLDAQSGKQVFSATHRMVKDRDFVLIEALEIHEYKQEYLIQENDKVISAPINITLKPVKELQNESRDIIYVDKEKLNFPLVVRKWQIADYFYPFGMSGKKKLSKFFKDEKLSLPAKEKQWLLCSGEDIVWVIGRRADNRFRITEETREILKIQLQK